VQGTGAPASLSQAHDRNRKESFSMTRRRIAAVLAAAGVAAAGALAATQYRAEAPAPAAQAARAAPLPDFAAIVQQYGPAVVNISTSGTRRTMLGRGGGEDSHDDDPFLPFFRGMPFQFGVPRETPVQGQGSGFIVSADGIVLTNAHVVREASEVSVKLTDRREFQAKVLGMDPATDIAVLRIDAKSLPAVRLGDPARTRVGDWVAAIGSPFGFENSVTAGIVSAKGRSLPGETYVPFLQTDVAVNPGNSGGPLFNLQGEVIGINSQIYSRTGGFMGVSFAIPIDVALRVKDQIVATGHAKHARLGVTVQQLNQALAESFGLKHAKGALVSQVMRGSAAERAGIEPGDVILKYDGKDIDAANDLSAAVGQALPGDRAKLVVWRKGGSRELPVTLGEAEQRAARTASAGSGDKGRLGVAVRPLRPEERREANVPSGLLVQGVEGAAARAGLQPGDIVLSANGQPVKSAEDLRAAAKSGKSVALLVQRDGERIFVPVRTG
jgi:serine protease Do